MAASSSLPSSFSHSVVTMVACVCPRRSATASSSFSCGSAVCERMMQLAFSTWSRKNSPKFFKYILHFLASTTVQKALSSECASPARCTARITSESFPTPEGSMTMRSGENFSSTSFKALAKSPTSEQQIQPEFISVISMPASLRKPPSTPISPNSFSMSTTFSPA